MYESRFYRRCQEFVQFCFKKVSFTMKFCSHFIKTHFINTKLFIKILFSQSDSHVIAAKITKFLAAILARGITSNDYTASSQHLIFREYLLSVLPALHCLGHPGNI